MKNCKQIATEWGLSERTVNDLCKKNKIDGAIKVGKMWKIPDDAKKPIDGRITSGKYVRHSAGVTRKPLPIGISDYVRAQADYYYVDKTMLIKEFLDQKPLVSLFTRPRRFGKTLNMDMLRVFFEISEENTSKYFEDKAIWQCGEEYRNQQGQYPVVFLTFKDVKFDSWKATLDKIRDLLQEEFGRHQELATSERIAEYEKTYFAKIINGDASEVDLTASLAKLSQMLTKHYGKARLLNAAGISAQDYSGDTKHPEKVMQEFKEHKIRFLCACDMISEGWDYPELGILVMARPTLSKVLYLQQIGRGLRRTSIKKNVFVIDVVDEYGTMVRPCSMHAIFGNSLYVPFGDITRQDYLPGQMIEIDGITERVERIVEVDIHTFEEKYGDYYSQEQLAREYFVNTGTITSWIRKGKIAPTVEFPFGSKKISLFSPEDVEKYRKELNIQEHNDDTVRDDFFVFLEERDYSLSYKMPFLLSFIDHMDTIGDAKIEDVLTDYIAFYQDRIDKGLPVDRPSCPYNAETLKDRKMIKSSMLTNPFEKFERKRFMYYSKDLGVISLNHALLAKMSEGDWERVKGQMKEDLERYYKQV